MCHSRRSAEALVTGPGTVPLHSKHRLGGRHVWHWAQTTTRSHSSCTSTARLAAAPPHSDPSHQIKQGRQCLTSRPCSRW